MGHTRWCIMTGWRLRSLVIWLACAAAFSGTAAATRENTFRFVVLSDTHVGKNDVQNERLYADLVAEIAALNPKPAAVFVTGDLTERGLESEYDHYLAWIVKPLRAAGIGHYAIPGNHEIGGDTNHNTLAMWTTKLGVLYQAVTIQNTHFILTCGVPEGVTGGYNLRSSPAMKWGIGTGGQIDTNQLAWIRRELEAGAARGGWVTVMMNHFPLWKTDFGGYEIQENDWFGHPTEAGSRLREWCGAYGVHLFVCGHRHYQTNAVPHVAINGRTTWGVLAESTIMGKQELVNAANGKPKHRGVFGYDVYDVDGRTLTHFRKTLDGFGGRELGRRNEFTLEAKP